MSDAYIPRRGGGAGLNLKVVGGTTAPTSPKGNTVWVNTDVDINGYAFSATQPTSPVAGMVWFRTGNSGQAAINIDKKNTVMLYPIACKQYISGAWVTKTAKTYLNGAWVDWSVFLYNYGATDLEISFETENSGVGTLESNRIGFAGNEKWYGDVTMKTTPAYDLTSFSTAEIELSNTGTGSTFYVGFGTSVGSYASANYTVNGELSQTIVSIDISSLSGNHYLSALRKTNETGTGLGNGYIYSVELKP